MQTNQRYQSTILLVIFLLLNIATGYSQKFVLPDSLKDKTADELEHIIIKYSRDSIKATFLSNALLEKAKQENDNLGLAKGYRQVSFNHLNDLSKRIAYLDSSIIAGKDLNDKRYPAISYLNRASVYKQIRSYKNALDDYLAALDHSYTVDNKRQYYSTKHNIGRLKEEIGEYEEAKKMYTDVLVYEDKNNIRGKGHLTTMLGLANTYRKLNQVDSATYYNKIGIKQSIQDSHTIYYLFVLHEGFNLYASKQYKASLDSINKSLSFIEKHESHHMGPIVNGYLYLSKIYNHFNEQKMSLKCLHEIDRHYTEFDFTSIEMREGYELLINHYKSVGDINKQLYYINTLFDVDSILDTNYKNLNKKIIKEYDTPLLLKEKQSLINSLEKKEKVTNVKLVIVVLFVIILIIFLTHTYRKNVRYKKRFKELMDPKNKLVVGDKHISTQDLNTSKSIDIPDNIISNILDELANFEEKKEFLSHNITTTNLAKKLNTNAKYLSRVVNICKQKSFSVYINELRIEYVIHKLKEDPKFRLYNVNAIAHEIGFNSDGVFATAFYKKTGIYPSYFIKQLEKQP